MEKRKLYGTIIGIIAFIAFIVAATYAWFTWKSGNTILSGGTGCFEISYAKGTDITGSISPSADYTGGRDTSVSIGVDTTNCEIETGEATINLTTNDNNAMDLSENALKYAVYNGSTLVGSGIVTGGTQAIASDLPITTTTQTYTIYLWLDGEMADDSYVGPNKGYSGYISASAVQTEIQN